MQCWAQPLLPTRQRNPAMQRGARPLTQRSALDVTDRKAKARPKEVQLLTTHFSPWLVIKICARPSLPVARTWVSPIGATVRQAK